MKMIPAVKHLFKMSNKPKLLDNKKKQYFYKITAKLIFLLKRAGPDILEETEFFTNRVKGPYMDD